MTKPLDDAKPTREQLIAELAEARGEAERWKQAAASAERVKETLAEVEARFRALFENSLDGIALHEMLFDDDGTPTNYVFLAVNRAFEEQTGLKRDDLLGRTVTEAIPGIEADPFIETYGEVAMTCEPVRFEQYASPLDRHYEIAAYAPRQGQFAVSFHDVTARKHAEQQLREHRDQLEALVAERTAALADTNAELQRSNAELEKFAYVASHDLQEPLRTISSFLQLLQQRYGDQLDDKADTYIRFAVDGAEHLRGLIQGLLAYSRIHTRAEEPVVVDCEQALAQVVEGLRVSIEERGGQVTHDVLPRVRADRLQIHQLLQNLVDNGLKFHAGDDPPHVHVSAERRGDRWRIAVRDHGIGIEPQYRERVFEVFQRLHTRDEYAGTGIGLAICRRIVERHDGAMAIEVPEGGGTRFVFDLPAADDVD